MNIRRFFAKQGFTLIELMVTVIVIGVISAIAAPSFDKAIDRIRFRSKMKEYISTLRTARSLAITRKAPYGVHFDYDQGTVSLFKDTHNPANFSYEVGSDSLASADTLASEYVYLYSTFTTSAVVFQPNGRASETGSIHLLSVDVNTVNFGMLSVLASTGRSRIDFIHYY